MATRRSGEIIKMIASITPRGEGVIAIEWAGEQSSPDSPPADCCTFLEPGETFCGHSFGSLEARFSDPNFDGLIEFEDHL